MTRDSVHPELEAGLALAQVALEEFQQAELAVAAHAAKKVLVRTAAIMRIMQDPAPSGKPHSWSSAEALRDTDRSYGEYKVEEARLALTRGSREFDLFAARQRVEYLSRTLPPMPDEAGYNCLHGIAMGEECPECDAGQAVA